MQKTYSTNSETKISDNDSSTTSPTKENFKKK